MRNYSHSHPDADLILIEPMFDDYHVFFSNIFSFSNRQAMCEHAYQQTRSYLIRHEKEVGTQLGKHGFRLRMDVLNESGRTLYDSPTKRNDSRETMDRAHAALDRLSDLLGKVQVD